MIALVRALLLPAWVDEVAYVDPGAQLAMTGKMISTAWLTNSPEVLWGSSNPGMPLLFAGWFKLVGFGQSQARLLFCLLHFTGVAFFFRWVIRGFKPGPWPLVFGIASSVLLPSLGNAIFQPRLECLAFLLCAWFLSYAWSDRRSFFLDWLAAPLLGLAIIFFGLHFAGFFALAAICAFIFSPSRRMFLQGAGLALGLIAGMAALWATYVRIGVWEIFVAARACHYGRTLSWVPEDWRRFVVTGDLPWLALLAGLGLFSAMSASRWKPARTWTAWLCALSVFFVVPLLIGTIGIYYGNYSWMVALPMMLCFYVGAPQLGGVARTTFISVLSAGLLAVTIKFSKPLPRTANEAERRRQVVAVLGKMVPRGASIAADFPLYYELAGAGYRVFPRVRKDEGLCLGFGQDYFLPAKLRGQIGCAVTTNDSVGLILAGLGGEWRMVAEIPAVRRGLTQESYQIFIRK
jgi:hypothetical protein